MAAVRRCLAFLLSLVLPPEPADPEAEERLQTRVRKFTLRSKKPFTGLIFSIAAGSLALVLSGGTSQAQLLAPTTTTITSNAASVGYGAPVTFTATVTSSAGTPGGTVVFLADLLSLGSATLNGSGQATFTTSTLSIGPHLIVAVYLGNLNYLASTSIGISLNITQSSCSVSLSASAGPLIYGNPVNLTVTVTPGGGTATPTGTVTIRSLAGPLGTVTLNGSGQGVLPVTLTAGTLLLFADYNGDSNFLACLSPGLSITLNKAATSAAMTSAPNPSVFGQSVTLTTTVTSAAGTPTGTVTFFDTGTPVGSAPVNGAGVASLSVPLTATGAHTMTSTYNGDANFNASTSPAITQNVGQSGTATAVTSSQNPSANGASVTFTATVTGTGGSGNPTGTVTFLDGVTTLGTGTLSGGQASFTTSALALGPHSITASYPGDANFTASTSPALSQSVVSSSSTTARVSSQNPSPAGALVVFTATVSGASGTPTGTVTFLDGASTLATVALNGAGQATFSTNALTPGVHPIRANYSGSATYAASSSPIVNQTTAQNASSTAFSVTPNPAATGSPVVLLANVTGAGAGTPTGVVTFLDNGNPLGSAPVNGSGLASFTSSAFSPGSHLLSAVYSGDSNYAASTGGPVTLSVGGAGATTTLASSANPSIAGQAVTFTAAVVGSGGTPTGTITFRNGATPLGTVALTGGAAAFTISSLAAGTHTITALYSGSAIYAPGASNTLSQSVSVPRDSVLLRRLQVAVTRIVAQSSGSAISGAVDAAIAEGFSEDGQFITASELGLRINSQGYDTAQRMGYASENPSILAADLPEAVRAPPVLPPPPRWLVWADTRHFGWNTNPAKGDMTGTQLNTLGGITFRLTPKLLVGALGGYESFDYGSTSLNGALHGRGWTVGGYMGWRPLGGLRFDAAAARSSLDYAGHAGTAAGSFPGSRTLVTSALSGNFELRRGLDVEPSVRVYTLWEKQDAYTDSLGTRQAENSFMTGRASAGGKLTYRWFATPRVILAPFAGVYADYNFTSGTEAVLPAYAMQGANARLTAGFSATTLNGASVTALGEIAGLGGGNYLSWSMRGRGTVPF